MGFPRHPRSRRLTLNPKFPTDIQPGSPLPVLLQFTNSSHGLKIALALAVGEARFFLENLLTSLGGGAILRRHRGQASPATRKSCSFSQMEQWRPVLHRIFLASLVAIL